MHQSSTVLEDNQKRSVEAIWAIGKTDFEIVRARIEEQFPGLNSSEVDSMMERVKEIREKGSL